MKTKVVIIGGGPSGLMAAQTLSKSGIDFILVEKNSLLGKKILISGSGRCNVTNNLNTKEFINALTIPHKKFLFRSLNNFGTNEVKNYFENNDCLLALDGEFKYFPKSNKAVDIRDVLAVNLSRKVLLNTTVLNIKKNILFTIKTTKDTIESEYVIIATGSKSFPKTGSSGDGIKFASKLDHDVIPFYPAETSIYSNFIKNYKEHLQGIKIEKSSIKIVGEKTKNVGDVMFTHFGLSGPGIQHISEFVYKSKLKGNNYITVSLTDLTENSLIDIFNKDSNHNVFLLKILESITYKRVARFIIESNGFTNKRINEYSKKQTAKIIEDLTRLKINVDRVEKLEAAFVNGGGVSTSNIHPMSFESKLVSNLYFVGETIDVHGPIGGFNITIALSSGYTAAKDISQKVLV